jgi:pyrimidine operon attenuation protein/uracil phosphoribosyltransferase
MPRVNEPSRVLLDAGSIAQAVQRMAREIAARNPPGSDLVLVGIQTGGEQLARQLAHQLAALWGGAVPVGQLDISMHRDDLDQRLAPKVYPTAIPFDIADKTVVLVDDVLFSGRTTRAALDALNDLGRPRRIQLAVLIDRGHRELPIDADFVGATIETAAADRVDVQWGGDPGAAKVVLEKPAGA